MDFNNGNNQNKKAENLLNSTNSPLERPRLAVCQTF